GQVVDRQDVTVLVEIVDEGAGHGGHGQEERELGRRTLVGPEKQRADDRRARARSAGNHSKALEKADPEIDRKRKLGSLGIFWPDRPAVDPKQDEAADDQRDADQHRAFEQHFLDEAVRQRANYGSGQKGDQYAENESLRGAIGRKLDEHVPQSREIDRENRQDRAELDDHLEHLAGRLEAHEMAGEKDVTGR